MPSNSSDLSKVGGARNRAALEVPRTCCTRHTIYDPASRIMIGRNDHSGLDPCTGGAQEAASSSPNPANQFVIRICEMRVDRTDLFVGGRLVNL